MCKIEGCSKPVVSRGLCSTHYQYARRTGAIAVTAKPQGSLEARFWAKVAIGDGCWEWFGGRSKKGYGVIQEAGRGSKLLFAHRVSYVLHKGPLTKYVLHSCDNPGCVNPGHLREGTQSENITEAVSKGRKFIPSPGKGEANPRSKLTLEQAKFIKANPQMKHTELATMFGLSPNCIRGVRIGRTWKDA